MDLVEISKMLLNYKACNNIIEGEPTPEQFRGHMRGKVFGAVFPYSWTPQLWSCAKQRTRA